MGGWIGEGGEWDQLYWGWIFVFYTGHNKIYVSLYIFWEVAHEFDELGL